VTICILGADPGISGAIAFYWSEAADRVIAEDFKTVAGQLDAYALAERIQQMGPDLAVVERVGAMPGQGVSSTFKFGRATGALDGILATLRIPVHFVSPSIWKKYWKLDKDKEKSRALAIQLFPVCANHFSRKKDHNRAEAALIARYGAEVICK
jgi:crossover junction endodeoxyribonuclease RuvC